MTIKNTPLEAERLQLAESMISREGFVLGKSLGFGRGGFLIPQKLSAEMVQESQSSNDRQKKSKEEAEQRVPDFEPIRPVSRARRLKRAIQVFDMDSIKDVESRAKNLESDYRNRVVADAQLAQRHGGRRSIPSFRGIDKKLRELARHFPNFAAALAGLTGDWVLAAASKPTEFRVVPILLNGAPGIGKTAFALALAEAFGLPFTKVTAGGLQHAASLVGTSMHWSNAHSGEVFRMLATGDSAVGLLVIDEVDKVNDNAERSIIAALLDLLEPESARMFKDESNGIVLDASRLIIVMTSNSLDTIAPPLLSRASVYQVAEPDQAQRSAIILSTHAKLVKSTRKQIQLDEFAVGRLADSEVDLREVIRAVRAGFSDALLSGHKVSYPAASVHKQGNRKVGF